MTSKIVTVAGNGIDVVTAGDEQQAKQVIIELAKALARIAAREDDARENGS